MQFTNVEKTRLIRNTIQVDQIFSGTIHIMKYHRLSHIDAKISVCYI